MSQMSAAQVMVVVTALREDDAPDKSAAKRPNLRAQPRVPRDVLLALARQHDSSVGDMKAGRNG